MREHLRLRGAALDVQSAISAAGRQLPPNMPAPPSYGKVNPADQPIFVIALSSDKAASDPLVSASPIPGNEESVSRTIDNLFKAGANVYYHTIKRAHVSGHASQEELKLMLGLTKPKHFIPMHGEFRMQVQHGRLAIETGVLPENVFIIENGTPIEIDTDGTARRGTSLPGSACGRWGAGRIPTCCPHRCPSGSAPGASKKRSRT